MGDKQGDAKPGTNIPLRASLEESDRRWCLRGIQITLVVRLAARVSSRSLPLLRPVPLYPFSCAVVRSQRMAHWWRIVKLGVILSFISQDSSSIIEIATNTILRMSHYSLDVYTHEDGGKKVPTARIE
jgi:hypothetical protein